MTLAESSLTTACLRCQTDTADRAQNLTEVCTSHFFEHLTGEHLYSLQTISWITDNGD